VKKEEIQLWRSFGGAEHAIHYGKLKWHDRFLRGKKMRIRRVVICFLCLLAPTVLSESRQLRAADGEKHLLYVAVPGIRNYVEYGGVGILVYDIGAGHKFVKRIPTWDVPPGDWLAPGVRMPLHIPPEPPAPDPRPRWGTAAVAGAASVVVGLVLWVVTVMRRRGRFQ